MDAGRFLLQLFTAAESHQRARRAEPEPDVTEESGSFSSALLAPPASPSSPSFSPRAPSGCFGVLFFWQIWRHHGRILFTHWFKVLLGKAYCSQRQQNARSYPRSDMISGEVSIKLNPKTRRLSCRNMTSYVLCATIIVYSIDKDDTQPKALARQLYGVPYCSRHLP